MQHVVTKLVDKYTAKFADEGRKLEHVNLWSDGCAGTLVSSIPETRPSVYPPPRPRTLGQFKNRNQMFFLVNQVIRMEHNFSMSAHGKGASDSEGAVVKSALHAAEFLYGEYFCELL